jgi:voltage-gated potassium channel
VVSGVVLLGGAEAYATAENVSLGTGIYWALQTMTTVGYGDVPPKTPLGKVVACVLMVVGIGFFALITGAIAQRFLATEVEAAAEEIEAGEAELLEQINALRGQLQTLEGIVVRRARASER